MELRKSPRFQVRFPVVFSGESTQGYGRVINISTTGCAVESEASVSAGMGLRLMFSLPGYKDPLEVQLAPVRWLQPGRFGLEFIMMPAEAQVRLRQFLSNL
jgi:hypothetical protein